MVLRNNIIHPIYISSLYVYGKDVEDALVHTIHHSLQVDLSREIRNNNAPATVEEEEDKNAN